jgi:hypothetical protein
MTEVVVELPDSVFSILQKDPAELSRKIRLVAAVRPERCAASRRDGSELWASPGHRLAARWQPAKPGN